MPFDSVGVAKKRRTIWGRGEGARNRRPRDFPMKLSKLPQTYPEYCVRFYINKACQKAVRDYRPIIPPEYKVKREKTAL